MHNNIHTKSSHNCLGLFHHSPPGGSGRQPYRKVTFRLIKIKALQDNQPTTTATIQECIRLACLDERNPGPGKEGQTAPLHPNKAAE